MKQTSFVNVSNVNNPTPELLTFQLLTFRLSQYGWIGD